MTIGIAAIASLAYSVVITVRVHRNAISDLSDRFGYGIIPLLCYAAGLPSAWLVLKESPAGLYILAAAALMLLLINLRNAWDLMTSLARHPEPKSDT